MVRGRALNARLPAALLLLASTGCAFSLDRTGAHYSVAFLSTGRHEVDRIAMDAEMRAKAECYTRPGGWNASPIIPIWTDETNDPAESDAIGFPHPVCANEGDFLADVDEAVHGAGLTAMDLRNVSIVQTALLPTCAADETREVRTFPACVSGYVVLISRGVSRADRRYALDAAFKVLLQARIARADRTEWGIGEPSGIWTPERQRQRVEDMALIPGWNDAPTYVAPSWDPEEAFRAELQP